MLPLVALAFLLISYIIYQSIYLCQYFSGNLTRLLGDIGSKNCESHCVIEIFMTQKARNRILALSMQKKGVEPSRYYYHTDLNRARLPIPPLLQTIDPMLSHRPNKFIITTFYQPVNYYLSFFNILFFRKNIQNLHVQPQHTDKAHSLCKVKKKRGHVLTFSCRRRESNPQGITTTRT